MFRMTPLAGAALALAAFAAQAQQPAVPAVQQQAQVAPPPHAGSQPRPAVRPGRTLSQADRQFMTHAARSGHADVQAGRLARERAADPAVREYGARLVDEHQAANTQLVRIAHGHGVTLPTGPSARQQRDLQRLASLSGAEFDHQFLQHMIRAHEEAVSRFRDAAQGERHDRSVRGYARQVLPTLEDHLQRARALHGQGAADARAAGGARAQGDATDRQRAGSGQGEQAEARGQVREAVQVVQRMKSDPRIAQLLERAYGVFIVPDYGRGAVGVGVQGGRGVLVVRQGGEFGSPAFYNMGGLSIGPQAGAAVGEVAFLLMTERAVQQFRSDRKFSLNTDAGLTVGNYSARGQASAGKLQDVVVWSGTQGAYAGISVGVTDVLADREANRAYYGRPDATPLTILGGRIEDPYGNPLGRVLGA